MNWELKIIEKHEIQKLGCDGKRKADENWMSAETSWVPGVAREVWRATSVQSSEGLGGKFKPYTPSQLTPKLTSDLTPNLTPN